MTFDENTIHQITTILRAIHPVYGSQNGGDFMNVGKSLKRATVINQKLHRAPKNWGKFPSRGLKSLKLDNKREINWHEIYPFLKYGSQNGVLVFEGYIFLKTYFLVYWTCRQLGKRYIHAIPPLMSPKTTFLEKYST